MEEVETDRWHLIWWTSQNTRVGVIMDEGKLSIKIT